MAIPFRTLFLWLASGLAVSSVDAAGQVAGEPGVVEFDGMLVQIAVQQGSVQISHSDDSEAGREVRELDRKLAQLATRIESHLARTAEQEERQFSDGESLNRGTNYAKKLLIKIELLTERIVHLGDETDLTRDIEAAASAFDVPLVKKHLQEKLALEDDDVAEAAFQLAGFQELDGEYQDAWGNYQKASNLEPDNQLYMDAHGKNEF